MLKSTLYREEPTARASMVLILSLCGENILDIGFARSLPSILMLYFFLF